MSSKGQPIIGVDVHVLRVNWISKPFTEGTEATLKKLLKTASFRVRNDALETDESWRHFISYQLVFNQLGRIFMYQRGGNIDEGRLSGLFSLGVGGHIEQKDFFKFKNGDPSYEGLIVGVDRELSEELHFQNLVSRNFAGFICSSNPPVDRVHLGLVYKVEIGGFEGVGEELAENGGRFVTIKSVLKKKKNLESWSQILLPHLEEIYKLEQGGE